MCLTLPRGPHLRASLRGHLQEIFPTNLRSSALGLCIAASRLGTFASNLLPVMLGSMGTLVTVGLLCAVAAPLNYFVVPETRGKGLSESMPRDGR